MFPFEKKFLIASIQVELVQKSSQIVLVEIAYSRMVNVELVFVDDAVKIKRKFARSENEITQLSLP